MIGISLCGDVGEGVRLNSEQKRQSKTVKERDKSEGHNNIEENTTPEDK